MPKNLHKFQRIVKDELEEVRKMYKPQQQLLTLTCYLAGLSLPMECEKRYSRMLVIKHRM